MSKPKPILPVRVIPVFRVHFEDLEAYIKQVFGFEYEYLESTGCVVGQIAEYTVTGELPSVEAQRKGDQIRAGRRSRDLRIILAVLVADGFIARGKYLICTRDRPAAIDIYRNLLEREGDPDSTACAEFRAKHSADAEFTKRATKLDEFVRSHK